METLTFKLEDEQVKEDRESEPDVRISGVVFPQYPSGQMS